MTGRRTIMGRDFYARPSDELAPGLLGRLLVRRLDDGTRLAGLIVEAEAYLGAADKAAHSYGGRRTRRNESMYGEPGTAYVYFTYGMHHCFNVVCGRPGEPVAVLIRALQPTEGQGAMTRYRRRAGKRDRAGPMAETDLCSGPAKLCQALKIDRSLDGVDLALPGPIWIEESETGGIDDGIIKRSPRIGVGYAGPWSEKPLRWFVDGNPHVSGRSNRNRIRGE